MFKLKGVPRANSSFSTNVRAALRYENWKLITGDPGIYILYIVRTVYSVRRTQYTVYTYDMYCILYSILYYITILKCI